MNYGSKVISKKIIIVAIFCLALIIGGGFWWQYYNSFTEVTIIPNNDTTITVGTSTDNQLAIQKPNIKTNQLLTKKIKKGNYQVLYSQPGYQDKIVSVSINKNTTIKSMDLDYTPERLNQILNQDKNIIQTTVLSTVTTGYSIIKEDIYKKGDWYSAVLMPNSWYRTDLPADYHPKQPNPNNTLYILRVVLHKDNGGWRVAAGPSIVLSIGDYPSIPQEIIRTVNNKDLFQ